MTGPASVVRGADILLSATLPEGPSLVLVQRAFGSTWLPVAPPLRTNGGDVRVLVTTRGSGCPCFRMMVAVDGTMATSSAVSVKVLPQQGTHGRD
ncbi:hypothetical protein EV189_2299 [Motilibacter rhizosphaerae]|uniref:Uncharacterized protein n=2 Tax=Motilibacter rhizosphaerae TaxID=598652 RepID=A0A4Q7NNZ0_9ACTN|nr:hypothetical protein EV189_2299 [Motilibacter rhizosphaerae]